MFNKLITLLRIFICLINTQIDLMITDNRIKSEDKLVHAERVREVSAVRGDYRRVVATGVR
jgi:hypothetical protein